MGQRMFVGIRPPHSIVSEISEFLAARPDMPWINEEQWHITLAFMNSVPHARTDELVERLRDGFARHEAPMIAFHGAGCFPNPSRAKVLWLRIAELTGDLGALSVTARNAANRSGASPDGKKFVPHLSVARLKNPIEATRWLRILDTFATDPWEVREVELIASYLGEGPAGRPRYETIARLPLA